MILKSFQKIFQKDIEKFVSKEETQCNLPKADVKFFFKCNLNIAAKEDLKN